jgi:hypothetical protein
MNIKLKVLKTPNFNKAKKLALQGVNKIVEVAGGLMLHECLQEVPVDTGALKLSHRKKEIPQPGMPDLNKAVITAGETLDPSMPYTSESYAKFVKWNDGWNIRAYGQAVPKIKAYLKTVRIRLQ